MFVSHIIFCWCGSFNEDIVEHWLVIGIFSIGMLVLLAISRTRCIWSRTSAPNASGSGFASCASASTSASTVSESGDCEPARENKQSSAKDSDYNPDLDHVTMDSD